MAARTHTAIFVLVTVFIDAIGFGIIMPVLPRLVMEVGDVDLAQAIAVGGWMAMLYAVAQFVFGPVMGNLGDRFGRRPVLLIATAGLAADYVLMAFAETLPLLFIGRLLAGIFGSSFGPAQAALADIAEADKRAKLFGYVGAAFGIGFVIGPAIGGLLGELDPRAPFYAAAGLAALNFVYGLTLFPETLAPENRRPFEWRRANPVGAWRAARQLPGLTSLAIVLFLWQVASLVYPLTWSYYGIARFGWSNSMIGASLAVVGASMAFAQFFIVGRVVARFGERKTAVIGLVAAIGGFVGYALVGETWLAFVIIALIAFQSFVQPSLTAMLSRRATAQTQGEVQGIGAMVMGLGAIVAPLLLNPALAFFTSEAAPFRFAGAAFAIAAVVALAALVMLVRTPRVSQA